MVRWATWAVAGAYVAARTVAAVARGPATSPDSAYYLVVDWSGRGRPPIVPAFYSLFPHDSARVGAQAFVAGAAWAFAAWAVGTTARSVGGRIASATAVLALGTTPLIAYWDRVVYSEALSIALAVVSAAALVRWAGDRRAVWLAGATVSGALWALTRPANIAVAVVAALALLAWGRRRREALLAAAIMIAAIAVAATLATRTAGGVFVSDPTVRAELGRSDVDPLTPNLLGIISTRVLDDPTRLRWFRDRGMPRPDPAERDLFRDARMRAWAQEEGADTYVAFLLTHPRHLLGGPLGNLRELLAPDGFAHTNVEDHRPPAFVTPTAISAVVLSPVTLAASVSWLASVLVVLALRRARPTLPFVVALGIVASAVPHLYAIWHGSAAELARLSVTNVALLRLGLIAAVTSTAAARTEGGRCDATSGRHRP